MHEGGGEGLFLKGLHYHQEQDGPRRHQICWCRQELDHPDPLGGDPESCATSACSVKQSLGKPLHRRSVFFRIGNSIFWSFDPLSLFSIFKKIDRARIGLVDLWKRLTVSESTRRSLKKKRRDLSLSKNELMFLTVSTPLMPKEIIAPVDLRSSIFFKDWRDRFALVDLWKRSKSKNNQFPEVYVSYCMVMCIV